VGIDAEEAVTPVAAANERHGLRFHAVPVERTELWARGSADDTTGSQMIGSMTGVGPIN
jgi:hypothetical protein